MKKQSQAQCNPQQNRQKLIQQNIKLFNQIKGLEGKMSMVITMDITKAIETEKKKSEVKVKFNEITIQEAYIRKLKGKIKQLRALNLTEVSNGIIAQENQLTALKKELAKLSQQKAIMSHKCADKKTALEYNNPLSQYKSETGQELGKIKKKNAQMAAKITELERQIRKYHKYQQMHKKFKDERIVIENPEYQYAKIDHQKTSLVKKGKLVEQKWKPQIQGLDREYFDCKQMLNRKKGQVADLQKELKNWHNRSSAVRNESQVLDDRNRLAKVISLSPKKESKQVSPPQNTRKQQSGVVDFFKNLFSKQNNNKDSDQHGKIPAENVKLINNEEAKEVRKWQNLAANTRYGTKSQKLKQSEDFKYSFTKLSEKNEFMKSKHSFQDFSLEEIKKKRILEEKKNKILTNSIAVGTSFYYNQED